MDCQASYRFSQDWPQAITMSMSTASPPACGAALSRCMATSDALAHTAIVLGVIDGVLLLLSMVLLFVLYSRTRRGREGVGRAKKGNGRRTAEAVVVERSGRLGTAGRGPDNKDAVISPPETAPITSDVGEKIEDRTLPEVPPVISLPAVTDDRDEEGPGSQLDDTSSFRSLSHSSTASLTEVSVNDLRELDGEDKDAVAAEGSTKEEVAGRSPASVAPEPVTIVPEYNPGLRHDEEEGGSAESLAQSPEPPGRPDTKHVTEDVSRSLQPLPPSSNSQSDVGEKNKERTLSKVPSVTPLPAAPHERQARHLRPQSDVESLRSRRHSSMTSLVAISVDDFHQGQNEERHPGIDALLDEGKFSKEAVGRLAPIPPKPGTVLPDYNPQLDTARPQTMNEYLNKYRIFFVIDDSRSMVRHWSETQIALSEIAAYALANYSDAVDIRFFNSQKRKLGVQGADQVVDIFKSVSRSAGTPTGRVLREVLDEQLDRLDDAQKRGTYSSERPLDIIVLTDGVPNVDSPPAPVIVEAAARLNAAKHHQNWIGIQFVQIGDNPLAEPTLLSLIDCENNNHMVDTVSYNFYRNEGGGKLTPHILERIVLGGLHPNLRSYFNIYRKKVNEKTSRMIY